MKLIRRLLRNVLGYDEELIALSRDIATLRKLIKDRTDISYDISYTERDASYAIMVGRYKDRDFVQTVSLGPTDFKHVVEWFRNLERFASVRRVDAPPMFKSVVKRESGGY